MWTRLTSIHGIRRFCAEATTRPAVSEAAKRWSSSTNVVQLARTIAPHDLDAALSLVEYEVSNLRKIVEGKEQVLQDKKQELDRVVCEREQAVQDKKQELERVVVDKERIIKGLEKENAGLHTANLSLLGRLTCRFALEHEEDQIPSYITSKFRERLDRWTQFFQDKQSDGERLYQELLKQQALKGKSPQEMAQVVTAAYKGLSKYIHNPNADKLYIPAGMNPAWTDLFICFAKHQNVIYDIVQMPLSSTATATITAAMPNTGSMPLSP